MRTWLLLSLILLVGCKTSQFKPEDVVWSRLFGENHITGESTVAVGDLVFTCDASTVLLIPKSSFTEQKIEELAGKKVATSVVVKFTSATKRTDLMPAKDYIYRAKCHEGVYHFHNYPDGQYFVVSGVLTSALPEQGYLFIDRIEMSSTNRYINITHTIQE